MDLLKRYHDYFASRRFAEGLADIDLRLAAGAIAEEDLAEAHWIRGYCAFGMATEAYRRVPDQEVERLLRLAANAYRTSLAYDPWHLTSRRSLARNLLRLHAPTEEVLELLDLKYILAEKDQDATTFYGQHSDLILRAAILTTLDNLPEAESSLQLALEKRALSNISYLDLTWLEWLSGPYPEEAKTLLRPLVALARTLVDTPDRLIEVLESATQAGGD